MAGIEVRRGPDEGERMTFEVTVDDGRGHSRHEVTAARPRVEELSRASEDPEAFIRRSFDFLLEREPKESILAHFDIEVIGRYFPEVEETIGA